MRLLNLRSVVAIFFFATLFSCTKDVTKQTPAQTEAEDATQALRVGQAFGGGIIFYLDATKQHGYIAATQDQGGQVAWDKGTHNLIGAKGKALGTGKANTNKIVNALGTTGNYAALICKNYRGGGFSDWFLPSKAELLKLYNKRDKVGGFSDTNYWSSTEVDAEDALNVVFPGPFQETDFKGFTLRVRPIRAF